MKPGRSTSGQYFECRACGTRVHSAAYRATCPACDGRLRSVRAARSGIDAGDGLPGAGERR